uniref:Transmembrane protein 8B n=1 Tax=Sphenodon punctatus TaxID=8508 RepID=A0A8D0H5X9_SPHPU
SQSSLRGENMTVFGCLNHEVPLTSEGNSSVTCETESLAGFLLSVNATSPLSRLWIPYPQTGSWYLSLRSLLRSCLNCTCSGRQSDDNSHVMTNLALCSGMWLGWHVLTGERRAGPTLFGNATLSSLAPRHVYGSGPAVSLPHQFYHACDQPGIVVFCIMEYDVLQFCDFLGSLMSVWVTVIAMARLQPVIKQVLYLLGAMLLSMALQLDRHGLWNLLGPSLFALGIMAIAWTARSIRRRHCYPPTWQRWLFYLLPGALIAAAAVLLYAFVETEENYFYIHSIWHMLIAGSVGFLLPPRTKPATAGPLPRRKGCGYQLCINEQEELGLVDPPSGASVTSICTS